jgi:hypothetical protein
LGTQFSGEGHARYFALVEPRGITWVPEERFVEVARRECGSDTAACVKSFFYVDAGCWLARGGHKEFVAFRSEGRTGTLALCSYDWPGPNGHRPSRYRNAAGPPQIRDQVLRGFLGACGARIHRVIDFQFSEFASPPAPTNADLVVLLGDLHLPLAHRTDCPAGPPGWVGSSARRAVDRASASDGWADVTHRDGAIAGAARQALDTSGATDDAGWLAQYYPADVFSGDQPRYAQSLNDFLECLEWWCRAHGSNAVKLFQVGDLYELWIGMTRLFRKDDSDRLARHTGRLLLGLQEDCLANTRGLSFLNAPADTSGADVSIRQAESLLHEWLFRADVSSRVLFHSLWETTASEDGLIGNLERSLTSRLFDRSVQNFTKAFVYGNHDGYLQVLTAGSGRTRPVAIRDTTEFYAGRPVSSWPAAPRQNASNRVSLPRFTQNALINGIHIEHGHGPDPHNQTGATSGWEITQGAFVAPWTRDVQNVLYSLQERTQGGVLGESDREKLMELAILVHIERSQRREPMIVFAMAHTHAPFMTEILYLNRG